MYRKVWIIFVMLVFGFNTFAIQADQPKPTLPAAVADQPAAITYWGANVYLTKLERIDNNGANDNLDLLASGAKAAGIQWSLEEFPWANIEPSNNNFSTVYDAGIKKLADNGFGIIGMLLTTPDWARESSCSGSYWCPPKDVNEYAQFAGWMAERYDGDGINDAPGSPKVQAWQIWNEPNFEATWNKFSDENARRRRYGEMMVAAYNAIKAANPSAIVVAGGVYIFDGSAPDGFDFFNAGGGVFPQVPAAKNAFDVFGIHPYMTTVAPDNIGTFSNVTLEGRLTTARKWVSQDISRPDAPIWITEIGWCSVGPAECPSVGEANQANYLVRSMVIAQQMGIQHTNWLQYEDAFDGGHPYSGSAMVNNLTNNTYPPKLAYYAYQTMTMLLNGATPLGTRAGVHTHTFTPNTNDIGGVYDYRYVRGDTEIDVLWNPAGTSTVAFPLTAGKVYTYYKLNGQVLSPMINNGVASLPVGVDPIFMVQEDAPQVLTVKPTSTSASPIVLLAEDSDTTAKASIAISNGGAKGTFTWDSSCSSDVTLNPTSGTASATPSFVLVSIDISALGVGDYPDYQCIITATSSISGSEIVYFSVKIVNQLQRTYLPLTQR